MRDVAVGVDVGLDRKDSNEWQKNREPKNESEGDFHR